MAKCLSLCSSNGALQRVNRWLSRNHTVCCELLEGFLGTLALLWLRIAVSMQERCQAEVIHVETTRTHVAQKPFHFEVIPLRDIRLGG